jgi:hypothetical protein
MRSPLGRRRWGNRAGDCDDCGRAGQVCCGEARLGRYRAARTRAWFATGSRRRRAALRRLRGPDRPCCRGGACDGGGCSREVSADRRLHDVCQPTHAFCSNSGIFSEHGGSSRGKARATLLHHLNRQNRDPFCSEAFTELRRLRHGRIRQLSGARRPGAAHVRTPRLSVRPDSRGLAALLKSASSLGEHAFGCSDREALRLD